MMLAALGVWLLAAAGPAAATAGPSEPTLSLADLQTQITAAGSGGLDGCFKTVLQGDTITNVPVKILSVAYGQNVTDGSDMILFQITDAAVLAQGGVAEGMSGSPLFVGDAGSPDPVHDPMVGAVSQGDIFTEQGLGLATPIDYMISIEQDYQVTLPVGTRAKAASSLDLPAALEGAGPVLPRTRTAVARHAVRTTAGHLHTFVMARSLAVARTLHPKAGTAVFVPLSTLEVGGLPAGSPAFKRLAAAFAKRGVDVHAAGLGAGGGSLFSTDLTEGASVAAVLSSGAFWAAYVGTVTYVDTADNVVLAFGHPADYDGPVALDMDNAWVSGIWSDSYTAYKLVSLGATQGVITQDRAYGIAGEIGPSNTEVPVDAAAAIGAATPTHFVTDIPQWVADNPNYGDTLIADACYWSVYRVTDAAAYPGHATMDTSVVVNDLSNAGAALPAITLDNGYDDPYDVGGYAGMDAADMVDTMLSNPDGVSPASVGSVTFSADLVPTHASMQILDFWVRGGFKHGANTVHVITRAYGETGTREEDLTVNVPESVETSGMVTVYDSNGMGGDDDGYGDALPAGSTRLGSNVPPATTLSDLVSTVEGTLLNDSLNVTFVADVPNEFVVPVVNGVPANYISASSAVTDGGTTWYVQGNLTKQTSSMHLYGPASAKAGRTVTLIGIFDADDASGTTVTIYRGTSTTPYATPRVVVTPDGMAEFVVRAKMLSKATRFTAVWDGLGSDEYIGATATRTVKLRK
jgi:hypothetical protein